MLSRRRRPRQEGRFEEEGQRLRKGGEPFWAIVTITTINNALGHHVGFANVTRDITERKQAEETLRLPPHGSATRGVEAMHCGPAVAAVADVGGDALVASDADDVEKIIAETAVTEITERGATRMDDQASEAAMETRKKQGYF